MTAYYIHYVPGRIRIQTPMLREKHGEAVEFERLMKAIAGITAVETHEVTGSSILHFDEKSINCEQIIGMLEEHGYFQLSQAETSDEVIEKATEKVLRMAEDIITASLGDGNIEG